jgi:hypothetical protein
MVPTPCASTSVAFTGVDRLTKNVSFGSPVVSPLTVTLMVRDVCPAVKFTTPLVGA